MKAVFCDFFGTVVHESGPVSYEVIERVYQNSRAASPEEVVLYWWEDFRKRMDAACGEAYRPQNELSLESFQALVSHFQCGEDPVWLRDRMNDHWCNPPVYEDAGPFLEGLGLPVYFVTNSDDRYIESAISNHGFHPAGVITSEKAKYAKPRRELFQCALDTAGVAPHEVIHIGDSLGGDVMGPAALGIKTLWLNREGAPVPEEVTAVSSLQEAQRVIWKWSNLP